MGGSHHGKRTSRLRFGSDQNKWWDHIGAIRFRRRGCHHNIGLCPANRMYRGRETTILAKLIGYCCELEEHSLCDYRRV
ncbi:hypothetical protein ACOME3_000203 [Neoechinorhynchus agilis]